MMNLDQYWAPLKIEQSKLLFVATKMIGEPGSEVELNQFLKDEDYTKFDLISKEVLRQMRKQDEECRYRYCKDHL